MDKFITFLENLRTSSNSDLIDTIEEGYELIFEALSTDDANSKPNGQFVTDPSVASSVNFLQNVDNEYFPQTLPDKVLNKVDKAYIGRRVAQLPPASRTSTGKDPLNRYDSSQNVNGVGGEYAGGGSGGLK